MLSTRLASAPRRVATKLGSVRTISKKAKPLPTTLVKPVKPVVLMFTGQGSQIPGMGKDLAKEWPAAQAVFDDADDALRMTLTKIMFEGPADALQRTAVAQPALVTHGMAVLAALKAELGKDILKATCAILGHSVGEITGHCAAEGVSLASAVKLAHQRGIYMQAAVPHGRKTGMAAFYPMNATQARALIVQVSRDLPQAVLDVACINSPKNVVLSGDADALEHAQKLAGEGALGEKMRVFPLDVSAPFHSRYMQTAQSGLHKYLFAMKMKLSSAPVINGLHAKPLRMFPDQLCEDFVALTSGTVDFVACIEQAKNILHTQSKPVDKPLWIEIGPKPTLTSFLSQTIPDARTTFLGTANDIKEFAKNKEWADILADIPKK